MKYLLSAIFVIFFMISCQDSSNIIDPATSTAPLSFNNDGLSQYELIPLPPKSPEWEDSVFTVSKEINGNAGGVIQMFKYYITSSGSPCFIYIDLRIPKNAFTGTKNITMTLDDEFTAIHFYPEMNFNKTLLLTQYFQCIDLIPILSNWARRIDFVYINDDGEIEIIQKNGIGINNLLGLVKVINARLHHFSRYGWIRKN